VHVGHDGGPVSHVATHREEKHPIKDGRASTGTANDAVQAYQKSREEGKMWCRATDFHLPQSSHPQIGFQTDFLREKENAENKWQLERRGEG